jgi:hypothetical protein
MNIQQYMYHKKFLMLDPSLGLIQFTLADWAALCSSTAVYLYSADIWLCVCGVGGGASLCSSKQMPC